MFGAVLAIAIATSLNKPLTGWRAYIPAEMRGFLAESWMRSMVLFVSVYLFCIVAGIFGWPLLLFFDATTATHVLLALGLVVLLCMLNVILAGLAFDLQKETEPQGKLKTKAEPGY